MDWFKPLQAWLSGWWAYIDWCVNADIQSPVCRPFWHWIMVAFYALGALVLVWVVARIVSNRFKRAAALKAQAERERVADEETMHAHLWDGDKAFDSNVPADEMRRRIRDALLDRKNTERPPPVV